MYAAVALSILFAAILAYNLVAVRGTFVSDRSPAEAGGTAIVVDTLGRRTGGRYYLTEPPSASAPLVIVLHGDAPFRKPSYQYGFAAVLAKLLPGTRVAALLRPGFADPYGDRSDGDRGFSTGDNYTPEVLDQLTAAIRQLQKKWRSPSVVLVGHSGGAVLTADIAALHPGLVRDALLIACPCDVAAFRRHMARSQFSPMWLLPTRNVSPLQTLDNARSSANIIAISGAADPIALPQYARAYVALAKQKGMSATFIKIPDRGHEILDEPTVVAAVAKVAR